MSRQYGQQEATPPKLYDTSVSSRGDSLTSWSSPHSSGTSGSMRPPTMETSNTNMQSTYAANIRNGKYIPSTNRVMSQDMGRKKSLPDNTQAHRNAVSSDGMIGNIRSGSIDSTTAISRGPIRKDVRLGIDTNLVNAVNRYNSDLYEIHKSPKSKTAVSEPGIGSNNNIASSSIYSTLNRAAAPSPLVPYDEAAMTQVFTSSPNNTKMPNAIVESPSNSEYDIKDRIRRLQQMKEDREKNALTRNGISSVNVSRSPISNKIGNSDPTKSRRGLSVDTITRDSQLVRQRQMQQQVLDSDDEQKRSSARELAKLYDLQEKQKKQLAIEQRRKLELEKVNAQRLRLLEIGGKNTTIPRHQPKTNMSKGVIPSKNIAPYSNTSTNSVNRPIHSASSKQQQYGEMNSERQRSRSLPPEMRNRQSTSTKNGKDPDKATRDESSLIHQLQYGNRVAEIETPSSARVCELKTMLWSPNEHLLVATKPSEYSEEHAAAIARIRQQSDSDKAKHQASEASAGRGQRAARSLSPKTKEQRIAMYQDFQGLKSNQPLDEEQGSHASPDELKNVRFKSRYYEAAQRNFVPNSPSAGRNSTNALPLQTTLQSPSARHLSKTDTQIKSRSANLSTPPPMANEAKLQSRQNINDVTKSRTGKVLAPLSPSRTNEKIESWQKILERSSNLPSKNTTKYDKVLLDEEPQNSSIGGSSKNEETVATLIAKLGAVKRDDPQAALEQIDAILIAESSRSDPIGDSFANDMFVTANEFSKRGLSISDCIEEKKTEIDFADVQPTDTAARALAGINARLGSRKKLDVRHDVEMIDIEGSEDDDSFFDETTVSSMTDPTYMSSSIKGTARDGFVGSNTAAGHPRPSNFRLYNNSVYNQSTSPKAQTDSTSPSNVERASDNTQERYSSFDRVEESAGQKEDEASRESEIEGKIRRWGKLSGSNTPDNEACSTNVDATSISRRESVKSSLGAQAEQSSLGGHVMSETNRIQLQDRDHPWDSSFPARLGKVDMNNTSMNDAAGIETTHTTKTGQLRMNPSQYDKRSGSPIYRMRTEGAMQLDTQLLNEQGRPNSRTNEMPAPWKNDSPKVLSGDFDSSWVSVPSTTLFNASNVEMSSRSNYDIQAEDEFFGLGTSETRSSQVVAGEENFPRQRQSDSLEMTKRGPDIASQSDGNTPSTAGGTVPAKAARGLRGLLKRKGASTRSSLDQVGNNVPTARVLPSYTSETEQRPHGIASGRSEMNTIIRGRDSNSGSASPARGRTKSLDERRIKSPSIARKFSRLLRVYDNEKDGMEV